MPALREIVKDVRHVSLLLRLPQQRDVRGGGRVRRQQGLGEQPAQGIQDQGAVHG